MSFLGHLGNILWDPWLLGLFLAVGGYFSLRTGFFQLFGAGIWLRTSLGGMFGRGARKRGGVTQLQAMATALAATIGTGSIAGVATAIFFGGPGAVFWMWVSAFLGMMTGCMEKLLAVRYRRRGREGFVGGPMCYMEDGLGWRRMAKLFSPDVVVFSRLVAS
jgi:AGCS family alanine or glycine:cation symporter